MTPRGLPVLGYRDSIVSAVESKQVTIVVGPTGSGKTTQVPQFLLDAGLAKSGMIACTEPKRVAAMSVATRVVKERNGILGDEVGYVIRHEWRLSERTKLLFATCGILLQTAISDPMLSKFSCVIVDEAHQRDLYSDFLLGYLKRVCAMRPDFRLVIMSATLQYREFLKYFPGARLVSIADRQHPITVKYLPPGERGYIAVAVDCVREIHQTTQSGDVLVFMPGEREIRQCYQLLKGMRLSGAQVLPLFGSLSPQQQRLVFEKIPERKIVIATNVAESSITIDNMSYVIDSGLAKEEGYDPYSGYRTLDLLPVSQDSIKQRTGRTGRVGPGVAVRLYGEDDYKRRSPYTPPAVTRSDVSELLLTMKFLGINRDFDLITHPSDEQWELAEQTLQDVGAIENDTLTERGRQLARLALELPLANFVLTSVQYGCTTEAVTIAAMLTVGRFFVRELYEDVEFEQIKRQFEHPESDFLTLLNIWDAYDTAIDQELWCRSNHVNPFWMNGVRTIRKQTLERLEDLGISPHSNRNHDLLDLAIAAGFKRNFLRYRQDGQYANLRRLPVLISRDSVLAERQPQYAVCYELKAAGRVYANCVHQLKYETVAEAIPEGLDLRNGHVPERAVRLEGELSVERGGRTKRVAINIDLGRSTSQEVRTINRRRLMVEEAKFPIALLPLSEDARTELAEVEIETLSQLPNAGEELAALGLSYPVVREILTALEPIGFLRRSSPLPARPAPKMPDVPGTEPSPDADRLAKSFLEKSIEALKLSGKAMMVLWGANIKLVGDLTERTEKTLLKELREYIKSASRRSPQRTTDVADVVKEVKARLMNYGLHFLGEKDTSRGFNRDLDTMRLPPTTPLEEEQAIDMLGLWYPIFKGLREGDEDDRIFCRNLIAEANLGLPGRFCRNVYWYWKMVDDPMLEYEDLFQEGCLGLLWAIEKYDYTRGFKLSTYAVNWITQATFRAMDNRSLLPVYQIDKLRWWGRQHSKLKQKLGAEPTRAEFAAYTGKSERQIEMFYGNLEYWRHFASADAPSLNAGDEDGMSILDYVAGPDDHVEDRLDEAKLRSVLEKLLNDSGLQSVDKEILTLRHGLFGHRVHTLEEVGEYLGVTRERVRQREAKALEKFRTKEVWEQVREFLPGMQPDKNVEHEFYIDDSGIVTKRPVSTMKVASETRLTLDEILDGVATYYKIMREELLDTRQKGDRIVIPQRVAMHLLTAELHTPYAEVSVMFAIKVDQLHELLHTTKHLRVEAQHVLDLIYRLQNKNGEQGHDQAQTMPVAEVFTPPSELTPDAIIETVRNYYGVGRDELMIGSKTAESLVARRVSMYLLGTVLQLSHTDIGLMFNREEQVVEETCKRVAYELRRVPESRGTMDVLRKRLGLEKGGTE